MQLQQLPLWERPPPFQLRATTTTHLQPHRNLRLLLRFQQLRVQRAPRFRSSRFKRRWPSSTSLTRPMLLLEQPARGLSPMA